jgi:hypothetical protein
MRILLLACATFFFLSCIVSSLSTLKTVIASLLGLQGYFFYALAFVEWYHYKRSINLLLTYYYRNRHTIYFIFILWFQRECTITMVLIWPLFLKSWSRNHAMVVVFIHPSTQFLNIAQLIKSLENPKIATKVWKILVHLTCNCAYT